MKYPTRCKKISNGLEIYIHQVNHRRLSQPVRKAALRQPVANKLGGCVYFDTSSFCPCGGRYVLKTGA